MLLQISPFSNVISDPVSRRKLTECNLNLVTSLFPIGVKLLKLFFEYLSSASVLQRKKEQKYMSFPEDVRGYTHVGKTCTGAFKWVANDHQAITPPNWDESATNESSYEMDTG
ncbi:hypothetical protein Y032_0213g2300 [Ancylostoma ceylanicum]|uniref:Uncharacterized protein n=1 Tax=Ancylostoma ceylanicum TaxID=53326 RepID=A0A016SJN5_9BILA|nr:hypothetical protein Y032_0213g2300 [Ancylostoma ceylanicum]